MPRSVVPLLAPTCPDARCKELCEFATSFAYTVSVPDDAARKPVV